MGFEILLAVLFILLLANFIILDITVSKMKKDRLKLDDVYTRKENAAAAVRVLEGLIRNLNAMCRDHQKRLDILEAGHPDSDIDYGEVDDDANVIAVWFNGKKYVPEDKRDENTSTFYADNVVVAETTRPEEKRCCATCQHYRPESGFSTCDLRTWLHATKKYATMADSACNNYEKTSAVLVPSDKDKVEYIRYDKKVDDLQLKIDYITLCQEQDKLRNKEIGFNKQLESALQLGIMSAREWREFMEDLDSDT